MKLPLHLQSPPTDDHEVVPTACQYCVVGCGYEAHLFPEGGGSDDAPPLEQAHWVSPAMTGVVQKVVESENDGAVAVGNLVAAVVPDPKCVMNKGNHSPRGGTQGRNLIDSQSHAANEDTNRERITTAYVRTRNGYEALNPDDAMDIVSALVENAGGLEETKEGSKQFQFTTPDRVGVKMYEYQYLENTYAATKLFFQMIGTPNVAYHDRPSVASNTQGFNDSGIDPHGYSYNDIWDSDVLFLAGNNPYENHSVFFMQYMAGKRIIVLDPRRTITADYAEKTGGIHLQPKHLGADTLILNALARYILEQQEDDDSPWPSRVPRGLIVSDEDVERVQADADGTPPDRGPGKRRQARYMLSLNGFKAFLKQTDSDGRPIYSLSRVAEIAGLDPEKLKEAAEMLAGPTADLPDPKNRKVSLIFEKGLIWGYSYQNTAAFANLGLLLGSVLHPTLGDPSSPGVPHRGVCGRAGGHQKGWAEVRYRLPECGVTRGYPFHNASDHFVAEDGGNFRTNHNIDVHLVGTDVAPLHSRARVKSSEDVRLLWIVGSNSAGQMGNTQAKWEHIQKRRGSEKSFPASANKAGVKSNLLQRIQEGGLVVIQQDIYPNPTTAYADLILPAQGWGEDNFTRYNGERRLRLYGKFQEPPPARDANGNIKKDANGRPIVHCLPDWKIFRQVAMNLFPRRDSEINGLKWEDFNQWDSTSTLFEELASNSNRAGSIGALFHDSLAVKGHDLLHKRGTNGVVIPVSHDPNAPENDFLKESPRTAVKERNHANGDPYPPYNFVKADWTEIESDFEANKRVDDEFYICNGRVNELWNSMFTHIRNETVRQRWPDNMPGPILELTPEDAATIKDGNGNVVGAQNGDVVEVQTENIHLGASSASFQAVVSIQQKQEKQETNYLPSRMAFAIFSYPAMKAKDVTKFPYRTFTTEGYVNNVTTGYVDPINPIAAVKYAKGKIVLTGKKYPENAAVGGTYLGPSYLPRSVSVVSADTSTNVKRIDWKMRELIVQKGLVRALLHGRRLIRLFRSPDQFFEMLRTNADGLQNDFKFAIEDDVMEWENDNPPPQLLDNWNEAEKALALIWLEILSGEPLT